MFHTDQVAGHFAGHPLRRITAALAILLLAATSVSAQKKQPPSTPVDINVANIKELEQLPGVGATTAKAIIDFRTKSGRFHRVEDLLVIRGISETKLKKMRPYITVGSPPAAKTAPTTKPPTPKPSSTPKPLPAVKPSTTANSWTPATRPAAPATSSSVTPATQ